MKIRSSTLRRAFFQLYRDLATAEGHFVSINELKDVWHCTGLRHSDLPAVLQDLVHARMAQSMERRREPVVRLELEGLREYHQPASGLVRSIEDWLTLTRLRLRRVGPAAALQIRQRKRRQDDRRYFKQRR